MLFAIASTVMMLSSGGLLSERVPAQGLLVGAIDLAQLPVEQLSMEELSAEKIRMEENRPGLGLGIGLLIGGGVTALISSVVFLVTVIGSAGFVVSGIILVAAVVAVVFGVIFLVKGIREKREYSNRMRAIDTRIAQIRRGDVIAPPSNSDVPPPPLMPPPPPPSSMLFPTDATMVLAEF